MLNKRKLCHGTSNDNETRQLENNIYSFSLMELYEQQNIFKPDARQYAPT